MLHRAFAALLLLLAPAAAAAAAAGAGAGAAQKRALRGNYFGPVIRPAPHLDGQFAAWAGEEGHVDQIYGILNNYRATLGLDPLEQHPALLQSANETVGLLAAAGLLQHDFGGKTALQRAKAAGYEGKEVKEDYARLDCDDEDDCITDVGRAWTLNSESQAAVIDPEARYVGVAAATGPNGAKDVFFVQHIGK